MCLTGSLAGASVLGVVKVAVAVDVVAAGGGLLLMKSLTSCRTCRFSQVKKST